MKHTLEVAAEVDKLFEAIDFIINSLNSDVTVNDEVNNRLEKLAFVLGKKVVRPKITKHVGLLKNDYLDRYSTYQNNRFQVVHNDLKWRSY